MKILASAAFAAAVMLWGGPALGADLGSGGCCSDLEERVAELEATAARSGNRKVTLSVSGFVGHQVMWWDDGAMSDMVIGDGGNLNSRFRFKGLAKLNPAVTAGFTYEFGARNNALQSMSQDGKDDAGVGSGKDDLGGEIALRDSTVWIRHKQLGMVKIGHGSTATDNLILLDLGGISSASTPDAALFNGGFYPQAGGATTNPVTWGHAINGGISFDTARRNHVLYETPSLAGFTVQAAVAENSFWDVALRYAGEFGSIRVAAAVGYSVDDEGTYLAKNAVVPGSPWWVDDYSISSTRVTETKGSAAIMHVPSGLFLNVAAGKRKLDGVVLTRNDLGWIPPLAHSHQMDLAAKDPFFWHVAGGISKNFFGIGRTAVFGEYQEAHDFLAFTDGAAFPTGISSSKVTMMGAGVVQHIDALAMELFAVIKQYELDVSAVSNGDPDGSEKSDKFQAVIVGTKISF